MPTWKDKILQNKYLNKLYFGCIRKVFVVLGMKEKMIPEERIWGEDEVLPYCQHEIEDCIKAIREQDTQSAERKVLVAGEIKQGRGLSAFFNELSRQYEGAQFYYLAESEIREKVDFPVFMAPHMFRRAKYKKGIELPVDKKVRKTIQSREYLMWALENTKGRYSDMGEGYAENFVYHAYQYLNEVLDAAKPNLVVLWLEFYAFHEIFFHICKERDVPVCFFEFGVLPGTYSLEEGGQMGESFPALHYEEFLSQKVTDEELAHAREVWKYLRENKVTRWPLQQKNDEDSICSLKEGLVEGWPTILVAGQNDYESGIMPYGEFAKEYHSPVFENSDQAAAYLGELGKKNHWNIIYKPHPAVLGWGAQRKECDIPENVITIKRMDISDLIDKVDVLVTIVSQMGYMALIRKTPAVMLGYTQLRGKKCSYEAFAMEEIEAVIRRAIEEGMTQEQKEYFILHIAQVLKYYSYDDETKRELRYGRPIPEAAGLLEAVLKKQTKH